MSTSMIKMFFENDIKALFHNVDSDKLNNSCQRNSTHSLLVVGVHKVLVPSPEVRHAFELGHSQDRDVPSVANKLLQARHGLGFHIIRHCMH